MVLGLDKANHSEFPEFIVIRAVLGYLILITQFLFSQLINYDIGFGIGFNHS